MTTLSCQYCGRPILMGAVFGNNGDPYHLECTHGPSGPLKYGHMIRDLEREIANLRAKLDEAYERAARTCKGMTSADRAADAIRALKEQKDT